MGDHIDNGTRPRLDSENEAVREMVTWFLDTFEIPDEDMPDHVSEYVHFGGGPYHAEQELRADHLRFGDSEIAEADIQRALALLAPFGAKWALINRVIDGYAYTLDRLHEDVEDVPRSRMTPTDARQELEVLRHLFDTLLTTKADAERVRIVNELKYRLVLGYSKIERVAVLSHLANEEPKHTGAGVSTGF